MFNLFVWICKGFYLYLFILLIWYWGDILGKFNKILLNDINIFFYNKIGFNNSK